MGILWIPLADFHRCVVQMYYMSHERHVLVRAKALDELVQLAEIAAERLDTGDPGMDSLARRHQGRHRRGPHPLPARARLI